jgi:hypothetical protein
VTPSRGATPGAAFLTGSKAFRFFVFLRRFCVVSFLFYQQGKKIQRKKIQRALDGMEAQTDGRFSGGAFPIPCKRGHTVVRRACLCLWTGRMSRNGRGGGGGAARNVLRWFSGVLVIQGVLSYLSLQHLQNASTHQLVKGPTELRISFRAKHPVIGTRCAPSCTRPDPVKHSTDRGIVIISDNPFVMLPKLPAPRAEEFKHVLRLNLASPYVAQVHFLNEAPHNDTRLLRPTRGGKLHVYDLGGQRSTFLDAMRYGNAAFPPGTIIAIANADIAFSHPSVLLATRLADPNAVLALTRYEVDAEQNTTTLNADPSRSQDVWIMRTPVEELLDMDFPLGAWGSDNKLAYLFKSKLHKTVYNWCEDVVLLHMHASRVRAKKPRLPLPYVLVPASRVNSSALDLSWRIDAMIRR